MLEQALRILRNRKLAFLQPLIFVPLAVLLLSLAQEPRYTATATLLFRENQNLLDPNADRGFVDPSRQAATNEQLVSLPVLASRAAREVGGLSAQEVRDAVQIDSSGEADVVEVAATLPSADRAARLANAYAESYIDFRRSSDRQQVTDAIRLVEANRERLTPTELAGEEGRELETRLDSLRLAESLQTGNAEVVQRAASPTTPSSPDIRRNLILALLFGAGLGFLLAALRERVDQRLKTVEELERIYDLPVLARVPRSFNVARGRKLEPEGTLPQGPEAEALRTLRANLRYFNVDEQIRSVLVASPVPGDGKSTIARMLATTMTAMGDNVVLLEADLRRPSVLGQNAASPAVGLSSMLAGGNLDDAFVEVPVVDPESGRPGRSLLAIPSGPSPPNPSELLESTRMQSVLTVLEERFELVIVDSPALSIVSDALPLIPQVSGVIVVSGLGQTTRNAATDFRKQVALLGGRPLGIVVNFAKLEASRGYYYYERSRKPAPTA